jgi:hypothetical protein
MCNKYILAGRYTKLSVSECKGIVNALTSLINVSNDVGYIEDAKMRLEALDNRISRA